MREDDIFMAINNEMIFGCKLAIFFFANLTLGC